MKLATQLKREGFMKILMVVLGLWLLQPRKKSCTWASSMNSQDVSQPQKSKVSQSSKGDHHINSTLCFIDCHKPMKLHSLLPQASWQRFSTWSKRNCKVGWSKPSVHFTMGISALPWRNRIANENKRNQTTCFSCNICCFNILQRGESKSQNAQLNVEHSLFV